MRGERGGGEGGTGHGTGKGDRRERETAGREIGGETFKTRQRGER
jgi:hypothetical protein